MKKRSLVSLALGLVGCAHTPLEVGQPVPAFSVPAHDDSLLTERSFAGKWVVFWFYPKADTPG